MIREILNIVEITHPTEGNTFAILDEDNGNYFFISHEQMERIQNFVSEHEKQALLAQKRMFENELKKVEREGEEIELSEESYNNLKESLK